MGPFPLPIRTNGNQLHLRLFVGMRSAALIPLIISGADNSPKCKRSFTESVNYTFLSLQLTFKEYLLEGCPKDYLLFLGAEWKYSQGGKEYM